MCIYVCIWLESVQNQQFVFVYIDRKEKRSKTSLVRHPQTILGEETLGSPATILESPCIVLKCPLATHAISVDELIVSIWTASLFSKC